MIDKTIVKYLRDKLKDYYLSHGFKISPKAKNDAYRYHVDDSAVYFDQVNLLRVLFNRKIECVGATNLYIPELNKAYRELFWPQIENDEDVLSVKWVHNLDLHVFFNYDDDITKFGRTNNYSWGDPYEIYSFDDANRYFDHIIKLNEIVFFPFFGRISSVIDLDNFLSEKILNADNINSQMLKQIGYSSYWWIALIAARVAKNPRYSELEDFVSNNCLLCLKQRPESGLLEVLKSILEYFEKYNL